MAWSLWQGLFGAGSSNAYVSGTMTAASADMLPFADGGVMTPWGSMPLRRYAGGGVATSAQMAIFGEGDMNEAFVPLPDGRSIPVNMRGGGNGPVYIDARGADRTGLARLTAMLNKQGASIAHVALEAKRRDDYRRGRKAN